MRKAVVRFMDPLSIAEKNLKYSIVCSRYQDNWIFVRNHTRKTWEMPAGHIETNETALQAAKRELYEETGAISFNLRTICDYTCDWKGETNYGRIYFANVVQLGELPPFEIAEIRLFKNLPENLTYPDIQNLIFEKVKNCLLTTNP
ncbi:NUDIX hydrolase [Ancylomarina longa]|uniref:NUDIX domain-containing protein n=1 Tax=Ancylomarina longa TaxID=2487017 RepID=A0A434AGW5_9BACT|nr:NUDIX domain-containing protein [Ancylomarina longa]RUT73622.1 NUDIX domain-containing protein [Ancylomarina longa]